ncbi:CAP domain-containing protein [Roseivivax sediminis]|uniref:Uncharacterized conserved protein YkwD, contains CAP (CSP/antigen 5/PR1) domain n=1 Tax=Roseivivax sediminis TaxID=936889 RepID=A0A1I1UHJ3_9RHOB|nr:CAP domain-containing protein [Roseivivax sediminis]SFD70197.1 Uncharacterized conserved protein YkwD, contains CAP (CSP/antigen 5/PR1) domain [Roseivivax sediminis]
MPEPTALEQSLLELINRARTDPGGEFDRLILDAATRTTLDPDATAAIRSREVNMTVLEAQLAALDPVPPLAWNDLLSQAAEVQTDHQIAIDDQGHAGPGGSRAVDRVIAAGYDWTGVSENVYASGRGDAHIHAAFFIDWSRTTETGIQDPPGHRDAIMNDRRVELGISVKPAGDSEEIGPLVVTQVFGNRADYAPQLLGVVIEDADGDDVYDIGEGLGGVTVTAAGAVGEFTTTTRAAGGYQMPLPEGDYTVTFAGGALAAEIVETVTMDAANTKLDGIAEAPAPDVRTVGYAEGRTDAVLSVSFTGGTLTLSGADAAAFVLDGTALRFAATPDFEAPEDTDGDNVYDVEIRGPEVAVDATITVTDVEETPPAPSGVRRIGTEVADILDGTDGDDTLAGRGGNDSLLGRGGDDEIAAADGNDTVIAGAGADNVGGGFGDDSLLGGTGNDTIGAGRGEDFVNGEAGDDIVNGGQGNDTIFGGAGNDTSGAGFNDDIVSGGFGDDSLGGGTGQDVIAAHDGDDAVGGGEGDDSIDGGSGDDFLAGGGRDDTIFGQAGADSINGGAGNDILSGGTGADIFIWNDLISGEADIVTDFEPGLDRLRLTGIDNAPGSGLVGKVAALTPTDTVEGAILSYDGQLILLENVRVADLTLDDFLFI